MYESLFLYLICELSSKCSGVCLLKTEADKFASGLPLAVSTWKLVKLAYRFWLIDI